jgi:hypothetical protein
MSSRATANSMATTRRQQQSDDEHGATTRSMAMTMAAGGRQRAWLANEQLIYSRVCSSSSVLF